ncbi:hypothetical protein B4Q13_16955 [Lacticaseibacillus rhamnosus]
MEELAALQRLLDGLLEILERVFVPLAAGPVLAVETALQQEIGEGLQQIVAVNVWYHVGSKDEEPRRNGFAHLFEHVMFQGSKHVPEDTYFRFLEKAGATSINGTISPSNRRAILR